jgi:hypothetical protein
VLIVHARLLSLYSKAFSAYRSQFPLISDDLAFHRLIAPKEESRDTLYLAPGFQIQMHDRHRSQPN